MSRLIDADELEKRFNEECCGDCGMCKHEVFNKGVYSCKLIKDSPTYEFNFEGFKKFVESRIDMQELYLPTHFFNLLDEYKMIGGADMRQDAEYKDSLSAETITDDIDMRSYMFGYLNGCEDSVKKFNELNKIQFSMPLREQYMKGGAE